MGESYFISIKKSFKFILKRKVKEIVYKKFYRKEDKHLNGKIKATHGKQVNQKMKTYLVLQYLLRKTDENHVASAYNITDYLDTCGITSERRSIYRDIEEINKANLILTEECDMEEAEEMLADDEDDELKLVVYDKSQKVFYVRQRRFELDDICLLAECVYTAKFVSENKSKQLLDVICEFVSEHQAEKIRHGAFLTDREVVHTTKPYLIKVSASLHHPIKTTKWA